MKTVIETYTPPDRYDAWVALNEAYDLQSGIYLGYDDEAIIKPYAVIAYHPTEERISGTLFDRWLRRYAKYNIYSNTSISFSELLQMDMLSAINVFQVGIEVHKEKTKAGNNLSDELKELEGK